MNTILEYVENELEVWDNPPPASLDEPISNSSDAFEYGVERGTYEVLMHIKRLIEKGYAAK